MISDLTDKYFNFIFASGGKIATALKNCHKKYFLLTMRCMVPTSKFRIEIFVYLFRLGYSLSTEKNKLYTKKRAIKSKRILNIFVSLNLKNLIFLQNLNMNSKKLENSNLLNRLNSNSNKNQSSSQL